MEQKVRNAFDQGSRESITTTQSTTYHLPFYRIRIHRLMPIEDTPPIPGSPVMSGKRSHDAIIDLTTSEEDSSQPQAKHPRNSQPQHARDTWALGSTQAEANVETDLVDASQEAEEGFGWTCVGAIDGKIVGVRYYNGYATVGESVLIKREPSNVYDSNAIRIDNVQGTQIGHLPRALAEKLAEFIDRKAIVLEGNLSGEKGFYDCPIHLKVYGPVEPNARKDLEDRLRSEKVPIKKRGAAAPKPPKKVEVTPTGRKRMGFQSSQNAANSQPEPIAQPELSLQDFVANAERFRPRDIEMLAEEWGAPEEMLSKMPKASQPKGLVSTLLPYQLQGLAWMLSKEDPVLPVEGSTEVVQLWRRSPARPKWFQNIATSYTSQTPPKLAKGGILADDMGLGKTLQIISLILEGGPGTTLIIAPVSVMSNWVQQAERHIDKPSQLKILTYHGSNRKQMTNKDFANYDVVITAYGTLSSECYPRGSKNAVSVPTQYGLFCMNWRRVVLDEGHTIRNPNTKASVAACSLMANSRWVLTGTPIVNTIKDLYSMLKFLQITGGLERLELFNAILTRTLAAGDPNAEILLQTIMRTMCLRRKKDMKFVDVKLPQLSEYVHRIQFRKDEKEKYDALLAEAKGTLSKALAGGKGGNAYRHVLEVLLRLRQVCCHWKLCGSRVADLLSLLDSPEGQVIVLNNDTRLALQALLQVGIDSHEDCAICLEELHNPVITTCKHAFGRECIERVIVTQHKCPMCRAELLDTECLVHPAVDDTLVEDADIDVGTKSSKTEALMSILAASRKDPASKVVIFSQWTSFLDIIEHQITETGYKFARIDGKMSAMARDAATRALDKDPECKILLASLAVASVGLNLVAADTVILADSWWAPAIEDQAVDRVHRLGQMRPCTVWRLIMEDSIEERVIGIQANKRQLVGKAFKEKAKEGKEKTTRMGDIQKLLS
ncbi:SNF2 family domain-containing protein [Phlyctema vagabunda]|uniref:SNF2 family domain-containing protein n=1 Tax=Phlyctema vagabunda TaxID=108571 RepID=A0ABR4PVX5_9HELO